MVSPPVLFATGCYCVAVREVVACFEGGRGCLMGGGCRSAPPPLRLPHPPLGGGLAGWRGVLHAVVCPTRSPLDAGGGVSLVLPFGRWSPATQDGVYGLVVMGAGGWQPGTPLGPLGAAF